MSLASCDFVGQAGCISVLPGPAILFEDVLNIDQFSRVSGHVKADRVGCGALRKLIASMTSQPGIAHLAHARLIRLEGVSRRPADAGERVAQGQSRRHAPGIIVESRLGVKIRARHCPV